jgi:uncharacterized protein (UPF0332 family)
MITTHHVFSARATENLQAAELLLHQGLFHASTNRAYYAAFHAAYSACLRFGVTVEINHEKVLRSFCGELVARQKIFEPRLKPLLYELQEARNQADYKEASTSKIVCERAVRKAREFVHHIVQP